ncbi:peroxisomal membrane protein [Aureococcus anophagefferens]|jgi:hypothetical protein|uniref:Peroxisomal membrane protein n=2 Tax=Aureococcus anophagefferens TaxID=44056 RepID=A0ABR1FQV3_AURAN|nr:hypothetical protein AURANDRAFT_69228 [Aureococcus anophagefferens]EGB02066.1 hypothetical protein AURANDRAFT_69228 [Aureococcus anophagefferens]|mmetsp:Transcript_2576/g.8095  ORF Transcript_2576/g.8095 Transcript_2576/m.8095 type:complete len:195 (-) Transcript_2576:50-634(-)|eukprot:XP_009043234.1 hypothetical protein AURANDRAFT_69228 [Aureococcus anophagefferens]
MALASLRSLPTHALASLRAFPSHYARFSQRRPHVAAAATAGGVMAASDVTCQSLTRDDGVDAGRTLALATFGFFHYGVTAKTLYLWYDRILGKTPTVRNAMTKMVLDVYVHTPLLLIPTFYAITCSLRGRSVDETASQLRREWWDASFGSAVFWTPLCLLNFLYVPQHSRIAAISVGSFVHKTWLSWLSNRHKI